jgi:peptide/nickel transport system substrate-binding protein
VNPKAVAAGGKDYASNPVGGGAGPFQVQRFAPGEEVVLKANPTYWGGPVCFEQLRFVYVPGAEASYDAFRAGELDMVYLQEARVIDRLKKDKVAHYATEVPGSNGLIINNGVKQTTPPTRDLDVRLAVAHAINRDSINERVYDGTGVGTEGAVFTGQKAVPYDLDTAKKLVTKAKAAGWDGRVRLSCQDTPEQTELSITVEAQLKAAGMQVERLNLPIATLTANISGVGGAPDYDLACWGLTTPTVGAISSLNAFESTSTRNRTGYADPRMDKALADYMAARSAAEVADAQAEVQKVWNETIPSVFLGGQEWLDGHTDAIHGLTYTRDSIPMFGKAYTS